MTAKRRRGGGPNDYEHRQADIVGKTAKKLMADAPSPEVGKVWARNYMRDAEDNKMSISASKNREDPLGADGKGGGMPSGYKSGGLVHTPKSMATMRGKARC